MRDALVTIMRLSGSPALLVDLNGGDLRHGDPIHLHASDGSLVVAEVFRIYNLDGRYDFRTGDRVALQAPDGQYVVAEGGGGEPGSLHAGRGAIGPWEVFVITLL
jgi:hypothetical protein